jgi:uncharacterized protein (DUF302 family)
LLIGLVVGAGGVLLAGYLLLPGRMIQVMPSRFGHDETVAALQKAIEANGWVVQGTKDLQKALAKHNQKLDRRVTVIQLCKPEYAKSVLDSDRHVACLMPCTIAVWEGDDGKTYLSKMNTGLMGTMFGGNIARVMGDAVSGDIRAILEGVVQ